MTTIDSRFLEILSALLGVVLVLSAAACGTDDSSPPSGTPTADTTVADTTVADTFDVAGPDAEAVQQDASPPDALQDVSADDITTADAPSPDSAPSDTQQPDSGPADSGSIPMISCGFELQWTTPTAGTFHAVGDDVVLSGTVMTAKWLPDKLKVRWSADDVELGITAVGQNAVATLKTATLPAGAALLQARVLTPSGACQELATRTIGMCANKIAESFDAKPTGKIWKTFGDAYWEAGGWLEMTGNVKSKQGAFYDVVHTVSPGDVSVRFRIATGGGINGGADGYALNFVEAATVGDLEKIIKAAGAGGCLGYGVSGTCGKLSVVGFHVEFDTWQNKGDPNTDPTASNHIGILLNGDASDHKLYAALTDLEDLKWHDVRVDVIGANVRVFWDGALKVEKVVKDLDFRGGRIFISGSTGWATNFHRLDDLVVLHGCK